MKYNREKVGLFIVIMCSLSLFTLALNPWFVVLSMGVAFLWMIFDVIYDILHR